MMYIKYIFKREDYFMITNFFKKFLFISLLTTLGATENENSTVLIEQNLTELENIQNDNENTQHNHSLNLNEELLLQNDDRKEIKFIEAQKIGENADLIFNIIETATNNYNKITKDNKKIEKSDQEGMKTAFDKIILDNNKPLSQNTNKIYREALYLSLDWDINTLKNFKEQLIFSIEKVKTTHLHTQMVKIGINIQIYSEIALYTVCCNSKTKNNLYNKKLTTEDLKNIKTQIDEIMTLRKQWQALINKNNYIGFFHNELLKEAKEVLNNIKTINTEIQTILKDKKS
ncbi:hypothetical protein BCO_0900072 (plasmid) [Borrelia coriaceae ATCC 43381]|uniref:Antigen P35 n=4 Tax=Borrelia coriaceae TaxID=144 RepID=W5SVQ0_9SPIR|nr:hypothetical protein BCO_0900072 [Borrelia coriaceae ATCC 43381]